MRHRTVFLILALFAAMAFASQRANAQAFVATDWIRHRAGLGRDGHNAGDIYPAGIPPAPKGRVWIWPPPADMPAEMAPDDTFPVISPMFPIGGTWTASPTNRAVHNFGLASAPPNSCLPAPAPAKVGTI